MTNPQGTADLGTFTKEIFNENLIFFYISSLFRSNSKKKKKKILPEYVVTYVVTCSTITF